MSDAVNKCKVTETSACCCVDLDTVITNEDCTSTYTHIFSSEAEAQSALDELVQLARDIESDPCSVKSNVSKVSSGFELKADFNFCCAAENLIFQFRCR